MGDQINPTARIETSANVSLRHSLITRFALFYTVLLVLVIFIAGWLLFRQSEKTILDHANERLQQAAGLAERAFYDELQILQQNCEAMVPAIRSDLQTQRDSPGPDREIQQLFQNMPSLQECQWITNSGVIEVHYARTVDNEVKSIEHLATEELDVFIQEALVFNYYDFYFSDIYIKAREGNSKLIQVAMPVRSGKAILLAAFRLDDFFSKISAIATGQTEVLLVDVNGQYVFSPDPGKEFGLLKGTGIVFRDEFMVNTSALNLKGESLNAFLDRKNTAYLNYIKSLDYANGRKRLYLLLVSKEEDVLLPAKKIRSSSLRIVLLLCCISLVAVFLFTGYFARKIRFITKSISGYGNGKIEPLTELKSDKSELGLLANTLETMQQTIDQTIVQLQNSLREEQAAKQERDEFLQNMSHEMRSPLHAILGLTTILKQKSPPSEQALLQSLERSAKNLSGLVYDVLDFRKLSEGELSLRKEAVNVAELITAVYETYQFEGVSKGLQLSLWLDDNLKSQTYLTDPLRLAQIITNLYINAIKYTNNGFVHMKAEMKEGDLVVEISDSGIGIQAENLNKINERFFRESQQITGRYGDYGLGLTIVRQLLELFGGKLTVQSIIEEGSVFSFSLPLEPGKESEGQKSNGTKAVLFEKIKILHIEDDHISHELIAYALQQLPVEISRCSHIDQLDYYLQQDFDLHITDVMLGELNLMQSKWWSQICDKACIIASGYEMETKPNPQILVLTKPFDPSILPQMVSVLVSKNEFDQPDWSNLYQNYDNRKDMVDRVLNLILKELESFEKELESLKTNFDLAVWQRLNHKWITHARDFKLQKMISLLDTPTGNLSESDAEKMGRHLENLSAWIRIELFLNSRG